MKTCNFYPTVTPPVECTHQGYTNLSEANRYWSSNDGGSYCDDSFGNDQWYRFVGAAGVMMASHCIPMSTCNTGMAGWINGAHPAEPYVLVSRTACMHSGSSCCHLQMSVKIRNCDGFYVYQLPALASCNARYCGVNGKTCPETDALFTEFYLAHWVVAHLI